MLDKEQIENWDKENIDREGNMKKLTLEEIKKLNMERTQGEWVYNHHNVYDYCVKPKIIITAKIKNRFSDGHTNKLVCYIPDSHYDSHLDLCLIEKTPQIAMQYIELAEALKKLNIAEVDTVLSEFGIIGSEGVE